MRGLESPDPMPEGEGIVFAEAVHVADLKRGLGCRFQHLFKGWQQLVYGPSMAERPALRVAVSFSAIRKGLRKSDTGKFLCKGGSIFHQHGIVGIIEDGLSPGTRGGVRMSRRFLGLGEILPVMAIAQIEAVGALREGQ